MFDEESRGWRASIVLGVSLCISLIFLIVAGAVYGSWIPFINLAAVVFMPAVVIIADSMGSDSSYDYQEVRQAWRNMGSCFMVRGRMAAVFSAASERHTVPLLPPRARATLPGHGAHFDDRVAADPPTH